jgi:hypothetical protein
VASSDRQGSATSDHAVLDRPQGLGQFGQLGQLGGSNRGGGRNGNRPNGGNNAAGNGALGSGNQAGQGGVTIAPDIQFKSDRSGRLEQRHREATQEKPHRGAFYSE